MNTCIKNPLPLSSLIIGFSLLLAGRVAAASFSFTGSMTTNRVWQTATLLPDGTVLVASGAPDRDPSPSSSFFSSAELYNPATGTWATTSSMISPHAANTATLLMNGKVLVAGTPYGRSQTATAELYDPASKTWTATAAMVMTRAWHTATLLPGGQVLVAGGLNNGSTILSSAELYDPATGTWAATAPMSMTRAVHTATLLPNGKVLVTGGTADGSNGIASAELYDPASKTWTPAGSMAGARFYHTATLLQNGEVLAAAGSSPNAVYLSSSELYSPATNSWRPAGPLASARHAHMAALLPDGKVLVAGGDGSSSTLSSAEMFDPATGLWSTAGDMNTAREWQTATVQPAGAVLVAGGGANSDTYSLASAELYNWTVAQTADGMALIPAGSFTMGDTLDGESDAAPMSVYVSAFYMDTNLVSYSQWQGVYNWATSHGYGFVNPGAGKAASHPVQTIDWYDCVKWCNARSQEAGLTPVYYTDAGLTQVYTNGETDAVYPNWAASGYRLPTEAEFEKAARGGLTGQRFPWGNTISESWANYLGTNTFSYDLGPNGYNATFADGVVPYTSPVGYFAPNGYGLYDMAGNVWKWCWDWEGGALGQPTTNNPTGPTGPIPGNGAARCGAGRGSTTPMAPGAHIATATTRPTTAPAPGSIV